jgi:DNA polymerase zeta
MSCSGAASMEPIACESLDCSWLYERKKLENKAEQLAQLDSLVEEISVLHDDTVSFVASVHHRLY